MTNRFCTSCKTPVPNGASFCPVCGEATPTEISRDTGLPTTSQIDGDEAEYRKRLQEALSGYQLGELIGRGGFGAVYSAWDVKLERDVAVKALRHDLFPTPDLLRRFEKEAKAVAKLRHPNILPVYAVGEGAGIAFMIMPRVDGENLRVVLDKETRLSVGEAVRIITEAAKGLQAAHKAGIIHRDVKPENILLEGDERQVLLMDFGIAKAAADSDTGITGSGVVIGSPQYMSPEQARGERNIDHRSDVYSLGAVAYELLTGEHPFKADNLHELVYRQVTTAPAAVHELNPEVPVQASHIVGRCLQKDADSRIESAEALWQGLEALAAAGERDESPPHRRGLWAAVAVLAAGAAIVAILTSRTAPDAAFLRALSLLGQADSAAESGDESQARELHCAALEDFPALAEQFPRGYCDPTRQWRIDRIDQEAIRLYTRALLYADRGDAERARELLSQVTRDYPDYTEAQEAMRQLQEVDTGETRPH